MKYLRNQNNPQVSLWDVMSDMEKMFDTAFYGDRTPERGRQWERFQPQVDFEENPENYLLKVDLPGMDKKDIEISMSDDRLTLSGERHRESEQTKEGVHHYERSYGRFERTFTLPKDVDAENIQARYENGVLEVLVPKTEAKKPKKIQIESSKGGLFSKVLGQSHAKGQGKGEEAH